MRKFITTICLAAALILSVITISGCNTMQGLGQDIQAGGQALESAAD